MDTRSVRPAKARRPVRRSMAELFGSIEGGAVAERLPLEPSAAPQRSPATARGENSCANPSLVRNGFLDEQRKEFGNLAVPRLPLEGRLNGSAPTGERMLQQQDEVALAVAKSAHYANRLVRTTVPADLAGEAASRPCEKERYGDAPELERPPLPSAEAADEYRTKALELINANMNATLEYAWRLARVRSPAEFVELSTKHACGQFKFIMTLPLRLTRF